MARRLPGGSCFCSWASFVVTGLIMMVHSYVALKMVRTENEEKSLDASWNTMCTMKIKTGIATVAEHSVELRGCRILVTDFVEYHCAVDIKYEGGIRNKGGSVEAHVFAGYFHRTGDQLSDERAAERECQRLATRTWPNILIDGRTTSGKSGWACGDTGWMACNTAKDCQFDFGGGPSSEKECGTSISWSDISGEVYDAGSCVNNEILASGTSLTCCVDEQKQVRLGNKAALLQHAKHRDKFLRSVHNYLKIAGFCTLALTCGFCVMCVIYTFKAFKDYAHDYQELDDASSSSSRVGGM